MFFVLKRSIHRIHDCIYNQFTEFSTSKLRSLFTYIKYCFYIGLYSRVAIIISFSTNYFTTSKWIFSWKNNWIVYIVVTELRCRYLVVNPYCMLVSFLVIWYNRQTITIIFLIQFKIWGVLQIYLSKVVCCSIGPIYLCIILIKFFSHANTS